MATLYDCCECCDDCGDDHTEPCEGGCNDAEAPAAEAHGAVT